MSARFPFASDLAEYWELLKTGSTTVRPIGGEAADRGPTHARREDFVPFDSWLSGLDKFDCERFRFSPAEAARTDPQILLFLELAAEALEASGYLGSRAKKIGVFGCSAISTRLLADWKPGDDLYQSATGLQRMISNEKDSVACMAAFKLNLTGPAVSIQTACSSSLVAMHFARRSLQAKDCDIAIVGGVALRFPAAAGYFYHRDMIFSPDGTCRPFDARAAGMFYGDGGGVLVLKNLETAIEDRDWIHAVLVNSAVNNDGADKLGFSAPSIDGQYRVISDCHRGAGWEPGSIGFVEAHGTATRLGDPVEIEALSRAFGKCDQTIHIGSVKGNIGHTGPAAGVAGAIKTILSVERGIVPPTCWYERPNELLRIDRTSFRVNSRTEPFRAKGLRRAAVSAFGVGGTNCHLLIEQHALPRVCGSSRYPVLISASDRERLSLYQRKIQRFMEFEQSARWDDVAYTLACHRPHASIRAYFRCAKDFARGISAACTGPVDERRVFWRFPRWQTPISKKELAMLCAELPVDFEAHVAVWETAASRVNIPHTADAGKVNAAIRTAASAAGAAIVLKKFGLSCVSLSGAGEGLVASLVVGGAISVDDAVRYIAEWGGELSATASLQVAAGSPSIPIFCSESGRKWPERARKDTPEGADGRPCSGCAIDDARQLVFARAGTHPGEGFVFVDECSEAAQSFHHTLAECWLRGHNVPWSEVFRDPNLRKVPIFARDFVRVSLPSRAAEPPPDVEVPLQQYVPLWKEIELNLGSTPVPSNPVALISFGDERLDSLVRDAAVEKSLTVFEPQVAGVDCAAKVVNALEAHHQLLGHPAALVFTIGNLASERGHYQEDEPAGLAGFLCTLFHLLSKRTSPLVASVRFLTVDSCQVVGYEHGLKLAAVARAAVMSLSQELGLQASLLDLSSRDSAHAAQDAVCNLISGRISGCTAVRGNRYWKREFNAVLVTTKPLVKKDPLTVLVTGGMGQVGLNLCAALASERICRFAIIGRRSLEELRAERGETMEPLLGEIETAGSTWQYFRADVSDRTQLEAAVAAAGACFGKVKGAIHCAGNTTAYPLISAGPSGDILEHFKSKVVGAENLDHCLRSLDLEFLVGCSSVATVLGGMGTFAYSAANHAVEILADNQGSRWRVIGWDQWEDSWRVLPKTGAPQIVALEAREQFLKWLRGERRIALFSKRSSLRAAERIGTSLQAVGSAPRKERMVEAVQNEWQRTLNCGAVHPSSNFFEQGGTSILAIDFIERLRERTGVQISVADVYAAPDFDSLLQILAARATRGSR